MSEGLTGVEAWPADRFFWAVIEAPGVRAGVLPPALEPVLQEEVPAVVDELHAVCVPIDGDRVLVCAARCEELAALGEEVLSLRPKAVPGLWPEHAEIAGLPPPDLLTGAFEALPLRRERARRTWLVAAAVLVVAGLTSVGFARRAGNLLQEVEADRAATITTIRQVSSGVTPVALQHDLEQLRSSRTSDQSVSPPDAAETLAGLLAAWPKGAEVEASGVSIAPATMSLSLSVVGDTRPLLSALQAPPGWRLEEPRLNASGNATRVSLTLRREGKP